MISRLILVTGAFASMGLSRTIRKRDDFASFSCGSTTLTNHTEVDPAIVEMLAKRQESEPPDDGQPIELNMIAHLCCGQGTCASEADIRSQVDSTNESYGPAKISFKLQKVEQVDPNLCAQANFTNENALYGQIMPSLHQGDKSTLNVVYFNSPPGQSIKGLCLAPNAQVGGYGKKDGCFVAMDTLQGFPKATTHELGHALGLLHPFPDRGQIPGGGNCPDGDGIPDTPPQDKPTSGCPGGGGGSGDPPGGSRGGFPPGDGFPPGEGDGGFPGFQKRQSTCQVGSNENNIMDYSTCTSISFTQGQIKHMRGVAKWRVGQSASIPLLPAERGGRGNPGPNFPGGNPGGQSGGPPGEQTGEPPGGRSGGIPGGPSGSEPGGEFPGFQENGPFGADEVDASSTEEDTKDSGTSDRPENSTEPNFRDFIYTQY